MPTSVRNSARHRGRGWRSGPGDGESRPARLAGVVAISLLAAVFAAPKASAGDPAGTDGAEQLLQQARNNRETLAPDFPGFRSRLVVHHGGRVYQGRMLFKPPITLDVHLDDADVRGSAKATIRSLLRHRLASTGSGGDEAVSFAGAGSHPLGRRISLGDKYGSRYRILANRILEVDRQMEDVRLLISVTGTETTASGTYLPTDFFVTQFDRESGAVKSASAYRDAYQRIGGEYLPVSRLVVSTGNGGTESLLVEWQEIELLPPGGSD